MTHRWNTLLAMKPLLLHRKTFDISPYHAPEWIWEPKRIAQNNQGIYSTTDVPWMIEYMRCLPDLDPQMDPFPMLGIVQVLGETQVQGKTLISKRAYLWGMVWVESLLVPEVFQIGHFESFVRKHKLVYYSTLRSAVTEAMETWIQYQLVKADLV